MDINFNEIERKWQKKWEEERIFEPNVMKEKKKFYLTAAFPYPNSPQHIGHARTYTTTDVYARYMRMKGHNVLLPMAFHVTGTPILAMAKRLASKDKELLEIFENIYKIPKDVAQSLTDPKQLVTFFSKEIEQGMREMGFSIDWRRKFYTFDSLFNKFIWWQFSKLHEKNLLKKGSHPVPWCPNCDNAIGAHDTQGDVDPELGEYVLIKFKYNDSSILTATFRPETIYGVTNIWYNPEADYAYAMIDDEKYLISKETVDKFKMQGKAVNVIKELKGSEINGTCTNPINDEQVPLYPASFVDPKNGSGIVMSVPAHAPYDFLALRDYHGIKEGELKQVLKIDGYGNFPAKEISEKMGIKDQNDSKADEATKEIYRKEAHTGVMIVGKYKNEKVIHAKEKIKSDLINEKNALTMHEIINGPVYCRCGTLALVKTVEGQWFINYGDEEWKNLTRECFSRMNIIPKKAISEYEYTINWLKEKACARASGLGTPFPFDKKQVIESLSDSTIYMAFYAIAHHLRKLPEDKINNGFFDSVFLGKDYDGIDKKELDGIRQEFLYWYPLDSRHSGADLIHNHLTFLIFNHVAVFPKEFWPKQIATNGFVLMEGKKMSKSLGNILPLREAIKRFGADIVRFSVVSGADLSQDSDFNQTMAEGISARLKYILNLIEGTSKNGKELKPIDRWLLSKLHRKILLVDGQFQKLEIRDITQEIFYNTVNDLRWYVKRTKDFSALREYLENWTLLISPFMPHISEEIWHILGEKKFVPDSKFVSTAGFPQANPERIDDSIESAEDVVLRTKQDIESILQIVKKQPNKIFLYVAPNWKRELYKLAYKHKKFDLAMKEAMQNNEIKPQAQNAIKVLQSLTKTVNELSSVCLTVENELEVLNSAIGFFKDEFKVQEVFVRNEDEAPEEQKKKASQAMPMRPSIYLE
ncbi:leucine--tRNA ligase [Candidatus Micrarchaeota archaeon]|nr:leucine--tRNA ligase [Candidatus Micrarchaeota archaeon]